MSNHKITIIIVLALLIFTSTCFTYSSFRDESEAVGSDCNSDCCRTLTDRPPMTYVYYQKTGKFVGGTGEYAINTMGYSGQGKGYLNPDEQCTSSIGPLPASTYKVSYCKNMMH